MKIRAVKELLREELGFNGRELEELSIKETMIATKGDGYIYCVFADLQDIWEIHTRIAESRNNDLMTRDFILPQLYERFRETNRICSEIRNHDKTINTQVKFGTADLEVLIKERGSEAPYKKK